MIIIFMLSVRLYVPIFQNLAKQFQVKTMFATGVTVGLAEGIIDDNCLVNPLSVIFIFIDLNITDHWPIRCLLYSSVVSVRSENKTSCNTAWSLMGH